MIKNRRAATLGDRCIFDSPKNVTKPSKSQPAANIGDGHFFDNIHDIRNRFCTVRDNNMRRVVTLNNDMLRPQTEQTFSYTNHGTLISGSENSMVMLGKF